MTTTHPAPPGPPPFLADITAEWRASFAHRPAADHDGTPWHVHHPVLAGCTTLQEILDRLRLSTPADADRILHSLLTLGHDGQEHAYRTVLQTELGVIVWLERQAHNRGLDDPAADAIAAMWATIRRYPLHRLGAAANLKMDALKTLARRCQRETPVDATSYWAQTPTPPPPEDAIRHARELLDWARTHQILPCDTLTLIERLHLDPAPASYADLAAEFHATPQALRQRHSRGVRHLATRIREAMQTEMLTAL